MSETRRMWTCRKILEPMGNQCGFVDYEPEWIAVHLLEHVAGIQPLPKWVPAQSTNQAQGQDSTGSANG